MPFLRMSGQPTAEDVIRHIEHAIRVCGEDHVGIGTDGAISTIAITPEYQRKHQKLVAERRRPESPLSGRGPRRVYPRPGIQHAQSPGIDRA